jgi:16S rRNA U516 pseudouridylate synthase RsuA-like enzyme
VLTFLAFHPSHRVEAELLARLISDHAVPVGSGTVARTERIPIEERAEAATIAWMRHQTTGYDNMVIPLVKGRRREVRRMLAQRSHQVLGRYRGGDCIDAATCPLARALKPHREPMAPASPKAGPSQMGLAL